MQLEPCRVPPTNHSRLAESESPPIPAGPCCSRQVGLGAALLVRPDSAAGMESHVTPIIEETQSSSFWKCCSPGTAAVEVRQPDERWVCLNSPQAAPLWTRQLADLGSVPSLPPLHAETLSAVTGRRSAKARAASSRSRAPLGQDASSLMSQTIAITICDGVHARLYTNGPRQTSNSKRLASLHLKHIFERVRFDFG